MKDDFSHSDQKLREKLETHRIPAPEGAWAGIEQQLPKQSRRRRFFFLFGLLGLLFIGGTTAWYLLTPSSAVEGKTANGTERHETPAMHNSTTSHITSGNQLTAENTSNDASELTLNTAPAADVVVTDNAATQGRPSRQTPTLGNNGPTHDQSEDNADAINTVTTDSEGSGFQPSPEALAKRSSSGEPRPVPVDLPSESTVETPLTASQMTTEPLDNTQKEQVLLPQFIAPRSNIQLPESYVEHLQSSPFDTPPKVAAGTWSLEAGGGFSTFRYAATSGSNALQQIVSDGQSGERATDVFLRTNYQPWKHLSVHSGLEFSSETNTVTVTTYTNTTTTSYDTTGWYFDSITQQQLPIVDTTTMTTTTPNEQVYNNQLSYINIPLGVMFHLPLGVRSELGIRLTGSVGILAKGQGVVISDENAGLAPLPIAYRQFGFHLRTALRYSYAINERQVLFVEPWFGFGLNNRSSLAILPYATRFHNTGVYVGFKYHF